MGFGLKPGAVQRPYLTAEFRTLFLGSLREMVGYDKGKHSHADLHSSRIAQDEKDVAAMVDLIKNWTDPFAGHNATVQHLNRSCCHYCYSRVPCDRL